jgi:hypothetical protein
MNMDLEQAEIERRRVAENNPTVGQVLACAAIVLSSIVIGVAGGGILLLVALTAIVVGGLGFGLVLVAVSLWGRAG